MGPTGATAAELWWAMIVVLIALMVGCLVMAAVAWWLGRDT